MINQRCVRWGGIDLAHCKLTSRSAADSLAEEQWLRPGDILWNSTGTGTIGRATVFTLERDRYLADSHITVVRASCVLPRWIEAWISTLFVQQQVGGIGSTNQVELSREAVLNLPIPFVEKDVQQRVLTRVDELFADIVEGEQALAEAEGAIGTYRAALLKAAVTGELTAEWRKANTKAETGEDRLRHILADRRARLEAKAKRQAEPASIQCTDDLPALPEGWCWARLEQLVVKGPSNGYSPKASVDGLGTKALKLTATSDGRMRLDSDCVKTLGEGIDPSSDLFLAPGDLLFQRGNTPELVGIAAIYDGPPATYIYPDLMIRVRTADPRLTTWVWRWATSPHGRAYLMTNAQGAAGSMPKISGQTLRDMPVPICGEAEREACLVRIEDGLARAEISDAIGAWSDQTLRQSILAATFRGAAQ